MLFPLFLFPLCSSGCMFEKAASAGMTRKNLGDGFPTRELPSPLDSILQEENCIILIKGSRTALLCQTVTGSDLLESPGPFLPSRLSPAQALQARTDRRHPGAPESSIPLSFFSLPPLEVEQSLALLLHTTPLPSLSLGSPRPPPINTDWRLKERGEKGNL